MSDDTLLRLLALDADDLTVISAHVQDAVTKVRDLVWLPQDGKFVLGINRFVWEDAGGTRQVRPERRRAGLHFSRVRGVRSFGIDRHRPDTILSLLAVRFEPSDTPSGYVEMAFSADATLRLSVECIEAQLTDLGPAWSAGHRPRHDLSRV